MKHPLEIRFEFGRYNIVRSGIATKTEFASSRDKAEAERMLESLGRQDNPRDYALNLLY